MPVFRIVILMISVGVIANVQHGLDRRLQGVFDVTAELTPPDLADPEEVLSRAGVFGGWVGALNATVGAGANCPMSRVAVCAILWRPGYAPILQIVCRDRNRIAIQGEVPGSAAMGVCNARFWPAIAKG